MPQDPERNERIPHTLLDERERDQKQCGGQEGERCVPIAPAMFPSLCESVRQGSERGGDRCGTEYIEWTPRRGRLVLKPGGWSVRIGR